MDAPKPWVEALAINGERTSPASFEEDRKASSTWPIAAWAESG